VYSVLVTWVTWLVCYTLLNTLYK